MSDLPDWTQFLRSAAKDAHVCNAVGHGDVLVGRWWLDGAAVEIDVLRARVAELEEALRPFCESKQYVPEWDAARRARRALGMEE